MKYWSKEMKVRSLKRPHFLGKTQNAHQRYSHKLNLYKLKAEYDLNDMKT